MQDVAGSGVDDQVLYFAANTLHKKSRQDVTDLNVSDLDASRTLPYGSLIVQSNKKNIQNRLCLVHAALCAHRYGLKPNEYPLKEVFNFFFDKTANAVDQQKYLCAGVELFTVLLEEATTDFLPISEDVRDIFVARTRIHADGVLIFLSKCLQMEIQELQRIFTCFKSWIKYGEITPTQLAASL